MVYVFKSSADRMLSCRISGAHMDADDAPQALPNGQGACPFPFNFCVAHFTVHSRIRSRLSVAPATRMRSMSADEMFMLAVPTECSHSASRHFLRLMHHGLYTSVPLCTCFALCFTAGVLHKSACGHGVRARQRHCCLPHYAGRVPADKRTASVHALRELFCH